MQDATTRHGETWDMLAHRLCGDEREMTRLLEANYALRDVAVFPHGVTVSVPDLPEKTLASDSLPPWKR